MLTKKLLTLSVLFGLGAGTLAAQQAQVVRAGKAVPARKEALKAVAAPRPVTGLEEVTPAQPSVPVSQSMVRSNGFAEVAGETYYDLQTNGTEQNRIHVWPDGNVSMAWTGAPTSNETSGWADRGSYTNTRSAWTGGTLGTTRTENVRTGFTNYVVAEDGTEMTFAHRGNGTGKFLIRMARRTAGATTWTQTDVPTQTTNGGLWAKAAVDGNYVHVLMLTVPVSSGGVRVRGMDGHVLYYRSPDAGATWDIVDGVIPGLDSTFYRAITADGYAITARDGVVAVATFDSWNASQLFKSNDNGSTWAAPVTMVEFPLVGYEADQGYTIDDIGGADPNAPDSLAVFTNDGGGSIAIDVLGNVHMAVGEMYVLDDDLTDANSSYFPGTNGFMYWSEANPVLTEISGSLDLNGNDTLDITNANLDGIAYGTGLSSMAAIATDDEGGLYVLYSAIVENVSNPDDGKSYRHVYLLKSSDFGATWGDPIDIQYYTNQESDLELANLTEAVYPSAAKQVVDGKLHFQYEADYVPGAQVLVTGAQDVLAQIVYVGDGVLVGTKSPINSMEFSLVPNPASGNTTVTVNLAGKEQTSLQVVDVTGAVVRNLQYSNLAAGQNFLNLNTSDLANGVYFVRVQSGNQFGTKKLVVMH